MLTVRCVNVECVNQGVHREFADGIDTSDPYVGRCGMCGEPFETIDGAPLDPPPDPYPVA